MFLTHWYIVNIITNTERVIPAERTSIAAEETDKHEGEMIG